MFSSPGAAHADSGLGALPPPSRSTRRPLTLTVMLALILGSTASLIAGEPMRAATFSFAISDDATILKNAPSSNYGSASVLSVRGSLPEETLMKFTISGVSGDPVADVKLRLYVADSSPKGGAFHAVHDTSWSEGSVTWSTAPPAGVLVDSLGPVKAGRWVEVNLTSLVTGDGEYALRVQSASKDRVDYQSSEASSHRPEVVVTLSGGTASPSASVAPSVAPTPTPSAAPSVTPTPSTGAVTTQAVADAQVVSGSPTRNYGSASTLQLREPTDNSQTYRAYLRFNIDLSGVANSLVLRVDIRDVSPNIGRVALVSNEWSEASITWATAPSVVGAIEVGTFVPSTLGWLDIPLDTSAFVASGSYSLALLNGGTNSTVISSRERGNPPTMVIKRLGETVEPSPTASASPSATPTPTATPSPTPVRSVVATRETVSLPLGSGDISDDSVIWADRTDPARSVVIADSKDSVHGGLALYDMEGRLLQFRPDGQIGNVDLRDGFMLGGRSVVLVGANNRSDDTLTFWEYRPSTRELTAPVTSGSVKTGSSNYGFCMYRSAATGSYYAFVTHKSGRVQQFQLSDSGGGFAATLVRELSIGSQTEGCVADDEFGSVYFAEEDTAIWRYRAEPDTGSTRTAVDVVGGHVVADIEGLSISYGPDGSGYLFVSSQGNSTFAVYRRQDDNAFVGSFRVEGAGTVDSVTGTDGLDVSTADLGLGFEYGMLVVHDESNSGGTASNLKYVPLEQVLALWP